MVVDLRARLSRVVSRLPDEDVRATLAFAEERAAQRDPLEERLSAAPEENEELADEEAAAIREGLADREAGRVYSSEAVERELGI
ncbi:MAG: hypothetical protein OXE58_16845 [Acidobacteria bacterium]|nr:hypothetical protein [Acidobacteriota bacterium]